MIEQDDNLPGGELVRKAARALVSDDHNDERGVAALTNLVDGIAGEGGEDGLREFAVALSSALAAALERTAADQGLVASIPPRSGSPSDPGGGPMPGSTPTTSTPTADHPAAETVTSSPRGDAASDAAPDDECVVPLCHNLLAEDDWSVR